MGRGHRVGKEAVTSDRTLKQSALEMTKRTEITIESHRLLVVRRRGGAIWGPCAECGERVQMVTPNEAAAIAGVSVRTINRWVEMERVHFMETADGLLFLCVNSLR